MRPYLLLDVDFTLNPDLGAAWDGEDGDRLRAAGWAVLQGFSMNARPVWLNIWHGRDLLRVAYETGAELAWATRWHQLANKVLSPVLGLPQLPVAPCDPAQEKPVTVIPWMQGRPFVWLDDEDAVAAMASDAPGGNGVKVDPATGLTGENLRDAAVLLEQLAGRARGVTLLLTWQAGAPAYLSLLVPTAGLPQSASHRPKASPSRPACFRTGGPMLAPYLRPALPRRPVLYLMSPMPLYGTPVLKEAREYPFAELTGCPVTLWCAEDLYGDNRDWAALWPLVRRHVDYAVFLDHLSGWVARGVRVETDGLLALGKPVWWFCDGQPTDRFAFGAPNFADWSHRHCRVGLAYRRPVRSVRSFPVREVP